MKPASTCVLVLVMVAAAAACSKAARDSQGSPASPSEPAAPLHAPAPVNATANVHADRTVSAFSRPPVRLKNRIAYVPPQCFTDPRAGVNDSRPAHNPCYVCHTRGVAPNYVDDSALQLSFDLPPLAATNPWANIVSPPRGAADVADADVLRLVRTSNYFANDGSLLLATALKNAPAAWDTDQDGAFGGYVPDAWFRFDDQGFDHRRDGSATGWRAFAYYPFLGTFFPTNGSADDVLIRLAPVLRENEAGELDAAVYTVNLAVVEAAIRRVDVPVDPVDETLYGVDLDLDGRLGNANRVAFDPFVPAGVRPSGSTRMHFVGRGRAAQDRGEVRVLPGMFPVGTEFLHTVRYLDVGEDGGVRLAARMKEVRYARKVRWSSYEVARANAVRDAREQSESRDDVHEVASATEAGIYSARGWLFQGFIESKDGTLRPQTYEETASCEGCHGGIGATTDSTFAFARKVDSSELARGWFHPSRRDLRGLREPRRADGEYEYSYYLEAVGAGDEVRANDEVAARFFDAQGRLVPSEITALHSDVSRLLLPSAARAIALDRSYLAIVLAQSFELGREALLSPPTHVFAKPPIGKPTGILTPRFEEPLVAFAAAANTARRTSAASVR